MSLQHVSEEVKAEIASLKDVIRETRVNEDKIMMLEQEKVKIQAALESERKKVEQLCAEAAIPTTPQPQVRLEIFFCIELRSSPGLCVNYVNFTSFLLLIIFSVCS